MLHTGSSNRLRNNLSPGKNENDEGSYKYQLNRDYVEPSEPLAARQPLPPRTQEELDKLHGGRKN